MSASKIKTNTFYSIIKTISTILFPLITFPYISRVIGPTNIGVINFSNSIVSYFTLIASLGVSTYGIRECARYIEERNKVGDIASQIFSINICSTIVSYILLFIVVFTIPKIQAKSLVILVSSISIIMTTVGCDWINTAYEDLKFVAIRTLFFQIISIIAMFIFVRNCEDYMNYVYISVFANSGSNLLNVFYRRKYCRIKFTFKMELKKHFKPILVLFALTLSQNIFCNLDVSMIGLFRNDYEVGLYSTSVKIYTIVSTLITAISVVIIPKLSVACANNQKDNIAELQKCALGYILTLGIPCIWGMNIMTEDLISFIAGSAYIPAANSLRILSMSLAFVMIGGGFLGNIVLLPRGEEKIYMIATVIATVVNGLLNLALIPKFGFVSAAWTTLLSEALIFFILFLKRKYCYIHNLWSYLKAPLIGSMCFIPVKIIIDRLIKGSTALNVCATIVCCVIVYILVLIIMKNDYFIGLLKLKKRGEKDAN